jgi:CapZ-interacting protein
MASMSILDDAIREHLELKRAHGADDAEIKRLEDEAFGPPGRPGEPDPLAEAPTEFMATPEAEAAQAEESGGRRINIADLQEAPPADAPVAPAEDAAQAAPPAEEEPPALEHEVVAEPEAAEEEAAPEAEADEPVADAGHSTEERHAIAEQPTEFFDVEAEMGTEDAPPVEAPSPSDEEIVEAEAAAPPLAPIEPATEIHASRAEAPAEDVEEEEDDDFWSEQRLSDELDQALEAPLVEEDEPAPALAPEADHEEPSEEHEQPQPQANYDPDTGHEDVLEDTPEFLEDAPEDDELWFEQKPPKDFDFDD